jgi:tryptophan-rich sensory protein
MPGEEHAMKSFCLAALQYVRVALLFAACGALSLVAFKMSPYYPVYMLFGFPVPFALLWTLLFMRTRRAVLIIPSMATAWLVSLVVIAQIGARVGIFQRFLPECVGGMVGGFAVTLSAAIGQRRLLAPKYLIAACSIGAISSIPFGFLPDDHSKDAFVLWIPFAIWQAAMGTYLYAICKHANEDA